MGSYVEKSDNLVLLKRENNEKYYVFLPRLLRLYPKSGNMRKMNIKEIALHLIRKKYGYKVYILTDEHERVKGSIEISNGGSFRYPFATKDDLIDGPSYTVPDFRGQGVAVRLGNAIMNEFETSYSVMYGTIEMDNVASLHRVKKNGFCIESKLKVDYLRRFQKCNDGHLVLVSYKHSSGQNKESKIL